MTNRYMSQISKKVKNRYKFTSEHAREAQKRSAESKRRKRSAESKRRKRELQKQRDEEALGDLRDV